MAMTTALNTAANYPANCTLKVGNSFDSKRGLLGSMEMLYIVNRTMTVAAVDINLQIYYQSTGYPVRFIMSVGVIIASCDHIHSQHFLGTHGVPITLHQLDIEFSDLVGLYSFGIAGAEDISSNSKNHPIVNGITRMTSSCSRNTTCLSAFNHLNKQLPPPAFISQPQPICLVLSSFACETILPLH